MSSPYHGSRRRLSPSFAENDGHASPSKKAAIRRKRIAKLFNYFQSWKIARLQEMAKPAGERSLPPFDPPKPDLAAGLLQSFEVECKQAIRETFIKAGQAMYVLTGMMVTATRPG